MKNKPVYRIKEFKGVFIIQILSCKNKGFLWWKRKEYDWCDTNIFGLEWKSYPIPEPYSKTFKSLKKASEQINRWVDNPQELYHYPIY